jgi:nucleoredoxin
MYKVPVSELEGKTVGLYFSLFSSKACGDFTPMLIDIYEKLKTKGEGFEVLLMPLDEEEESFNQGFGNMPWFSLPVKDEGCEKLVRYFELSTLPAVVIIGPDGKTLHSNVAEAIKEHGVLACRIPIHPRKVCRACRDR